jgi:hypothetical protein
VTGYSPPGAQPSRHRRTAGLGRRRRAALLVGCALAVLIVAGAVIALAPRGGTPNQDSARMAQAVRQLAAILDFSALGNLLSKEKKYHRAVENRTEVARRLARFHPPQALHGATATLTEVTRLAIRFNRLREAGHSAGKVDDQANALRVDFLTQFNPYAQRYLGRSYQLGDF